MSNQPIPKLPDTGIPGPVSLVCFVVGLPCMAKCQSPQTNKISRQPLQTPQSQGMFLISLASEEHRALHSKVGSSALASSVLQPLLLRARSMILHLMLCLSTCETLLIPSCLLMIPKPMTPAHMKQLLVPLSWMQSLTHPHLRYHLHLCQCQVQE